MCSCWAVATPGWTPARWTLWWKLPTFVQTVEQRQGIKISAPEEIAYKYGWITKEKLLESAARYGKSPYGQHLKNVADDKLQY